jgi:peptidoglycan/LPS O-acetylase OafA/YrhL
MVSIPQLTPDQPFGYQSHGLRDGLAFGFAAYEYIQWRRYQRVVGFGNETLRGWRIWKHQRRLLRRAQPRLAIKTGLVALAVLCVVLFIGWTWGGQWNGHSQFILYLIGMPSALVALVATRHHRPPAAAVLAIDEEARRYSRERLRPLGQR